MIKSSGNLDEFVVWGSAGHAKVIADLISLNKCKVIALFDNNLYANSCLENVPIYFGLKGLEVWLREYGDLKHVGAALAIGGSRGKDRQQIAEVFSSVGLTLPLLIHPSAVISKDVQLGKGSQVLANSVISAAVTIGDACIINNSVNVDHECMLENGVHLAPGAVLCGCVSVGENSMIGAGAVVLPRIIIGRNVVVGAGSVVTRNIPNNTVVAGNPARIMRGGND